ncbi:flagellar basal body-associated FliL family protein [Candidatus Hepatobacter penaei]|uniref:flagellar basal body-associated FliL family protein n=1 Tax=Candidatus Hepatobacter penaei TaxID=1274402 RepID=UPI00155A6D78|nr:flagellar basal body-associated FliL family protein [Candidatus Hepatobacter penaei]
MAFLVWSISGVLHASEAAHEAPAKTPDFTGIYVVVPDMLSNLHGDDTRNHFLKLCLTFEAESNNDAKRMNELMPIIIDQFIIYLRELRMDDLKGAEGVLLLKQQLLDRANVIFSPIKVRRVLIRQILVQ